MHCAPTQDVLPLKSFHGIDIAPVGLIRKGQAIACPKLSLSQLRLSNSSVAAENQKNEKEYAIVPRCQSSNRAIVW
jgi:hypothetical protein